MSFSLKPVLRPNLPTALTSALPTTYTLTPTRSARLLRRPKRPYTFTQLLTLSDGSAFTIRTTSPHPVYRSSRDTRNAPLWNPSSQDLQNVEEDEAGRLAGFRARFGKGFDANKEMLISTTDEPERPASGDKVEKSDSGEEDDLGYTDEGDEGLLSMISSYGVADKGSAAQIAKKRL